MENNNQPPIGNQPFDPTTSPPVPPSPAPIPAPVSAPNPTFGYPPSQPNYPSSYPPQVSPVIPLNFGAYSEPPKSKKILRVSIIFVILLVVGVGLFFWFHKSGSHNTATKQNVAVKSAPKVPPPLVTLASPATLEPGTFTVGTDKNIVPGLYSLSPGTQQSGDITITTPTSKYSVTLDDNSKTAGQGTPTAWTQLSSGDKIQISGGNLKNVTFKSVVMSPSTAPALAKLYKGSFTITDDPSRANPGKYFIYDKTDKDADILIIAKDYTIKYNQPLDANGFLVSVVDGDQVATVNVTQFAMEPR